MISGVTKGMETQTGRMAREREAHKGSHKENTFPKQLAGKSREAEIFVRFCNQGGSKTGGVELHSMAGIEP